MLWKIRQPGGPPHALQLGQPLICPLNSKEWVSCDTVRLRFDLPSAEHVLGLPVPGHLMAVDNAMIYRPYSPTTIDAHTAGHFDLLVRHYPRGEISSKLARLAPGDRMHFRGPVASRFEYRRGVARRLGLVAAGTGIAPMWQARASSRSHTARSLSRMLYRIRILPWTLS
jgi:cytochrome-b5 reductase